MTTFVLDRTRYSWQRTGRRRFEVEDALQVAFMVCCGMAVAAFVIASLVRLSYPYPLELTEPASLEEVKRVLRGEPLYVAPTLQHVPMVYGPVYFYLSAALAALTGATLAPLRLVSLLASLGTFGLMGWLVKRETGRWIGGVAAVGLLAIADPLTQTAYDTARVDALFVFFLMAAIVVARTRTDLCGLLASGVLLGLAGLTKLPVGAAPVAGALGLYLLVTTRARVLAFVAGCALVVVLGLLALRLQSGPWPTWYMLDLPSKHVINNHGDELGRFWFVDTLPRFTLPLLIGPLFLFVSVIDGNRRQFLFYGLVNLSLIGLAWAARSNSGGSPNVLVPAFVAVALFFGLGLDVLLRLLRTSSARVRPLRAYVLALCILELALNAYNPRLLVPYRSEEWAADRLSAKLGSLDGPLFGLNLDGYVQGSDKGEQPLTGALLELTGSFGGSGSEAGEAWKDAFSTALAERRFSHVVLIEDCCEIEALLARNGYVDAGPLFPPNDDYWLWTSGFTPTDIRVYVPR
ncbi:MAG: glycosyltransferase family 39 protein [Chloroflexi bacterium]|nr:glycosyltransferase family 39 protein [Chloroflexota bacterium]